MNNTITATETNTNQEVNTMETAVTTETINQEEKTMGQIFEEATITMGQTSQNEQTGNQIEERKPRDPAAQFVKLAETRTTRVLDTIDSLGKLASKKNYVFTKEQVDKMFNAIQERVEEIKKDYMRILNNEKTEKRGFTF